MSIIKHTLVLVLLATLVTFSPTIHANDDDYSPPDNYVDILFSGDQTNWPNWKHALVRLGILDSFKTQCEAGTLPWVSPSNFSRTYRSVSDVGRVPGNSIYIDPFPMSEFAYPEPDQWQLIDIGLIADSLMTFGVTCMFVSPTIDVLLICQNTQWKTQQCNGETVTLEPGFTWLLIDDNLGVSPGYYSIKTRCRDRTNTCPAGGITGVDLSPKRSVTSFTPRELRGLLNNPTGR